MGRSQGHRRAPGNIHVFGFALRDGMAASRARHGKPRFTAPKWTHTEETSDRQREWRDSKETKMRPRTPYQAQNAAIKAKREAEAERWIAEVRARKDKR